MSGMFLRIEAPHFCAHAEIVDHHVGRGPYDCAPIIAYMRGWNGLQVKSYCARKGWRLTVHAYPEGT